MKKKMISLSDDERIALQVLIKLELRKNKECEKIGIEPAFRTKGLKELYKKIAGYECEEEVKE